jgi:hypothetical protein
LVIGKDFIDALPVSTTLMTHALPETATSRKSEIFIGLLLAGVNDTGEDDVTGVNNTGKEFIAVVVNNGEVHSDNGYFKPILYRTSFIPNFFCTELIFKPTYFKQNLFYADHILHRTHYIPNLFYIKKCFTC